MFASMTTLHSTHIGIKAGLQILAKGAAVNTKGRNFAPLFKFLNENNKKGALKTSIDKSLEQMKRLFEVMSTANKTPDLTVNGNVLSGAGAMLSLGKQLVDPKNTDINDILSDRAKCEAALEPAKKVMEIFGALKKSSDESYDDKIDFVNRLRPAVGVDMLFDLSNDGFYKLGGSAKVHFFGNGKSIGDKNSEDFISVANPFGFSFGLLGSIGMFHLGVNLAFDKLNADLKGTSLDLLKSTNSTVDQLNSLISEAAKVKTNLNRVQVPASQAVLANITTSVIATSVAQIDAYTEILEKFKKDYTNPFTSDNKRIADGMYCSVQGFIGVEFAVYQDLLSLYADLIVNLPLTAVKGVENTLGHGVEFKRGVSLAIEAGIKVNL